MLFIKSLSIVWLLILIAILQLAGIVFLFIRNKIMRNKIKFLKEQIKNYNQNEKNLLELETRYKEIFEHTKNGVAVYKSVDGGEDFVFIDFNTASEKIDKISRKEVIGKRLLDVFPNIKKFGLFDLIKRVFITGNPENYPTTLYKDDRISGWRDNFVYKLPTGEIVVVYSDETERKEAEFALSRSENKYRQLVEQAYDGIFMIDYDDNIFEINSRLCDIFGYSREECLKLNYKDLISPENLEKEPLRKKELYEQGNVLIERIGIRKNGTRFPIEVHVKIIEDNKILGLIRDISDRKAIENERIKLESQQRHSHKMEAIGVLAGGIAHDFNNILGIILGNTELAILDDMDKLPIRSRMEQIKTACLRAKDIIKQILIFSRNSEVQHKSINLGSIIQDSLKLLRASIPSTIEIRQNICAINDIVLADPTQMNQVILNLGTNAAHAMKEKGGIMQINLNNIEINQEDITTFGSLSTGKYLRLSISDTGHGIDPAIIDRIMDPYFTTKGIGEGTGMGLALVQGILKNHGGIIKVGSVVGKGTTFDVYIPEANGNVISELKEVEDQKKRKRKNSFY